MSIEQETTIKKFFEDERCVYLSLDIKRYTHDSANPKEHPYYGIILADGRYYVSFHKYPGMVDLGLCPIQNSVSHYKFESSTCRKCIHSPKVTLPDTMSIANLQQAVTLLMEERDGKA